MAVAIAAAATTNGSTAAANPSISIPATVAGDLFIGAFFATATYSGTPAAPTGWTHLFNASLGGAASGDKGQIMYRFADGSEGSTIVVSTGGTSVKHHALFYRISGVDTGSPPEISTEAVANSAAPNPGSLTPSGGSKAYLWLALYTIEGIGAAPSAIPTNYTSHATSTIATSGSTAATNARQAWAYRALTAATEDPGAFTAPAAEDWSAWTIAVYPSAGTLFTKSVAGGITPAGALTKETRKLFVAGFTPSGVVTKQTVKSFAGSITPNAVLTKQIQRRITAAIAPPGVVVNSKLSLKSFGGVIVPAGTLIRRPQKVFVGAITPIGTLTRESRRTFAGAITPTGSLTKQIQRRLTAALTPAGALSLLAVKTRSFAGSITPVGTLTREVQKRFTGTLAPTGTLLKQLQRRLTGAITPTGTVAFLAVKTITLTGTIAPVGTLTKQVRRTLTGTLASTGALLKMPMRRFTGAIGSSGTVANVKTQPSISLAGTLTMAGALRKSVSKSFAGAIVPIGTIRKQISRRFTGAIAFVGALVNIVLGPPAGSIATLIELRSLLAAADPTMAIDLSGAQPFTYKPDVLYVWEDTDARTPVAQDRATFGYIAAVGVPDHGEQARQISDRDVTLALQTRATLLMNALRSNAQGAEWDYLTATLDADFFTSYGVRGFAFRITGYRLG